MKSTRTAPEIAVLNLQRKIKIDIPKLQDFGQQAAQLCLRLSLQRPSDLARLSDVCVVIVSDRRMASLHQRFMNESGPTDVLTFQHGEIFISAETAARNSRRFGNRLTSELRLCIVHGLLHLHGFDDRDAASAGKMRAAEAKILSKVQKSSDRRV